MKRNKILKFDQYCKEFKIESTTQKIKDSNKAERVMFIRVGGTIVVKNRRRYSFSEYSQKMALLKKYAATVINLNNLAQHTDSTEDLHYAFEEAVWESCLPEGRHKIVAVGDRAYAVRPMVTKWGISWYPVSSGLTEPLWTSLRLGVFSSFDLALKALVSAFPALNYLDPAAPAMVAEHLDEIKLMFKRKNETKQTILENLAKLKKTS
jgi:hypothetical protein